jgi:hypothetical protein
LFAAGAGREAKRQQLSDPLVLLSRLIDFGLERLMTATNNGVTTAYAVNAQGQRASMTVGGTNTRFIHAGQNTLLAENSGGTWSNYVWFEGELLASEGLAANAC